MNINEQLKQIVQAVISDLNENLQGEILGIVQQHVSQEISKLDIVALFNKSFAESLKNKQFQFPESSIPVDAIDKTGLLLSGDNVSGGIVKNFGSTGIDDKATDCRLTILDEATVVENNLVTQDLTVKGSATIEGDLIVTGRVPESSPFYLGLVNTVTTNVRTGLDYTLFKGYADLVTSTIKQDGLDLNKITCNGQDVITNGAIGSFITSSNLQQVGTLHELRVGGESLLSQTLYTTNKRVGINTIEPTKALSIWDQEIEFGFSKRSTNVGAFETPRNQTLVISTNGKDNLTLTPEGGVVTNNITVGSVNLSSSNIPPSYNAPIGNIVFNSNPTLGGPLGWISLGNANWANFGFID